MCAGVGEGHRERGEQKSWSGLCADSSEPNVGLKLTNCEIMTWADVRCSTNWATQVHLKFIYFWERESMNWGGADGEGQRIQSGLCADSSEPSAGLKLINREIMTRAEVKCLTDWAAQVPPRLTLKTKKGYFLSESTDHKGQVILFQCQLWWPWDSVSLPVKWEDWWG